MVINEVDCLKFRNELSKIIDSNSKLIKMNVDLAVIPTVQTEFQYKAYARLKSSQERQKFLTVLLRVVSEISVISGAIAVFIQVFV